MLFISSYFSVTYIAILEGISGSDENTEDFDAAGVLDGEETEVLTQPNPSTSATTTTSGDATADDGDDNTAPATRPCSPVDE